MFENNFKDNFRNNFENNFKDNYSGNLVDSDEQYSKKGAICPYCGYLHEPMEVDYCILDDTLDILTCDHCGENFNISVNISYSWTTKKIGDN